MRPRSGLTVAGVTLDVPLGSGGQGEVWRGHDASGTAVAVKILNTAYPDQVLQAMREARLQGTVDAPNIVKLLDFQLVDDTPVIVSELVDGVSLQQLLRRGRVALSDVDHIARQLFDGVEAAHQHGLIHRDLKPANVLLERRRNGLFVKLTDFGIAVESTPFGAARPRPGEMAGTVGFMAPEQYNHSGHPVDHRADLFGLGAVLYWLATGRRAFSGPHRMQVLHRATAGDFPPVRAVAPEVPEAWAHAIVWALDPSPRRRPQDIDALRQAWVGHHGRLPAWVHQGRVTEVPTDPEFVGLTDVLTPDPETPRPSLPTSFGRDRDLERVRKRLARKRVVTLRGFAGVGKTHLARQVAREVELRWGGNSAFCQLTEASTEAGLLVALAAGLQIPVRGAAPIALLGTALAGRGEVLVVLDNAEQVAEPLRQVLPELMKAAPQAQFLITSRQTLGLPKESVLPLDPLSEDAALELYLDRAKRIRPRLVVKPAQLERLREVVRTLDGIPLAIELAAARVADGSVEDLIAGLDPEASGTDAAMRAALRWSWKLLRPWEQTTLASCAVFRGGFTAEDAEEVVDLSGWPGAPSVMEVVHRLVDHSLVQVVSQADGTERLNLFGTVRSWAMSRLDPEARFATDTAHLALFRTLGSREGVAEREGPAGIEAIRRAMAEVRNLAAALDTAVARRDTAAAADCGFALGWVLTRAGPPSAGIPRLSRVLGMADLDDWNRSRLLAMLSHLLGDAGDYDESEARLREALELARASGDREQEAHVLQQLAAMTHHSGDLAAGLEVFHQALELVPADRHPVRRAAILRLIAAAQTHAGDLDAADRVLTEAMELAERHHIAVDLPSIHIQLGALRAHQGRPEEATVFEQLALLGARRLGDRVQEGRVLTNLGIRFHQLERPDDAITCFQRSARIAADTGGIGHQAIALGNLAETLASVGRTSEAEEALEQAIELGDRTWKVVAATFRTTLARIRIRDGRFAEGRALLDQAAPALEDRYAPGWLGLLFTRAELHAREGDLPAAARWLARADQAMRSSSMDHEAELVALRRGVIRLLEQG